MKQLKLLMMLMMFLLMTTTAFAHGNVWYDRESNFGKITNFSIHNFEGNHNYNGVEYMLQKRLTDKVKKVNFFISESNNSEAYIVCKIRMNEEESRYSPESWENVTLSEYVEVTNSPRGNYKTAIAEWVEEYHIAESTSYFRKLNVDFIVYANNGDKLMSYNYYMKSSDGEMKMFDEIIKDFVDELKDARKECKGK